MRLLSILKLKQIQQSDRKRNDSFHYYHQSNNDDDDGLPNWIIMIRRIKLQKKNKTENEITQLSALITSATLGLLINSFIIIIS